MGIKINKKSITVVNTLADKFVKQLDVEPELDTTKHYNVDGTDVKVGCELQDSGDLYITVTMFNTKVGANFGTKAYRIDLFDKEPKQAYKLPDFITATIVECLNSEGISFTELGNGLISDSLELNGIQSKIWISNDLTYISISNKILEDQVKDPFASLGL